MSSISESLADLDVLVVDCQATGAAPRGHLLEIGWARAGTTITRADARLIALPEGEHIPPAVMRLTGITEKMSQVTPVSPRTSKSGRGDWIRTSDPLRPSGPCCDFMRCSASSDSLQVVGLV